MTGQQQQQQQESKPRQLPILISGNSISTSNLHLPPHQSTKNSNSNHPDSDKTNIEELYKIIEIQQKTINKLTAELTHKSQGIPRGSYQKALNSLENEKYEHSKTKMQLIETKDRTSSLRSEVDYYKNEMEKERSAYGNVFELLKDKAIDESTKSIDLISKIAETEIKYNDAVQDIRAKEKKYTELCNKVKQKEKRYEDKVKEFNLNAEQEKYINQVVSNGNINNNNNNNNANHHSSGSGFVSSNISGNNSTTTNSSSSSNSIVTSLSGFSSR